MQRLNLYSVLSNEETKKVFDQYGEEILKEGAPTAKGTLKGGYSFHGNSLEVFRQFFGTANPYCDISMPLVRKQIDEENGVLMKEEEEKQERDITVVIKWTLLEFYHGCVKQVIYTRDELRKDGKTVKQNDVTKDIQVMPGYGIDTVLKFPMKGHEEFGKTTTSLIVKFSEIAEKDITREGNDLIQTHTISLQDALQATSVHLLTLNNDRIELSIDQTITPQTKIKVEGQGMPIYKDKDYITMLLGKQSRGNLYVRFNILFPKKLTQEQKDELTSLLSEE